ncbi:MAG: UDP-glucose/GDP-mannose dehydrogenase family protein [Chloroflexi bacterium]|nr:UDP-glucose/GDP-mannose dehydrogenase family protein [Chloroflexota bacterium]
MTPPAMSTAFVGLSHLGIVSSAGWASQGNAVLAVDADRSLVDELRRGELPIHEPGLPELIESSRGCLEFSADLARVAACDLVVIARDVPTDARNMSDLALVEALVDELVPHLRNGVTLAIMSQVSPGFSRAIGEHIRKVRADLRFELYYWVETLIFGDAVRRTLHPERFIIGCHDPRVEIAPALQTGLRKFGCPILPMRYESAELAKTAINLYLISSVTYANTLADVCESIGADWSEVVPALRLDRRIGPAAYLRPGLGIAGGNLERDLVTVQTLCGEHDVDATFLDALARHNANRLQWAHRMLSRYVLDHKHDSVIGVWGLTYKKDTRSVRNSPSLRLIAEIGDGLTVRAWDPVISPGDLESAAEIVDSARAAIDGADCLVIMNDWDEFAAANIDMLRDCLRQPIVVDCAGVLEGRRDELAGFTYVAMGR